MPRFWFLKEISSKETLKIKINVCSHLSCQNQLGECKACKLPVTQQLLQNSVSLKSLETPANLLLCEVHIHSGRVFYYFFGCDKVMVMHKIMEVCLFVVLLKVGTKAVMNVSQILCKLITGKQACSSNRSWFLLLFA